MEKITEMTLAAVRNGEPLESIRDRVLVGVINSALIRHYGNQTQAANQLGMSRRTIRAMFNGRPHMIMASPVESALKYREAWHHLSRVAVMEAIEICGGNRTLAKDHLKCSKFVVWRYSR